MMRAVAVAVLSIAAVALDAGRAAACMGDYTLSITGTCPGRIRLEWSGALPDRQQAIVASREEGHEVIPSGQCAGTVLGLGPRQLYLVRLYRTGSGSGFVNANTGQYCGWFVQLVEGGTCRTSNVVLSP